MLTYNKNLQTKADNKQQNIKNCFNICCFFSKRAKLLIFFLKKNIMQRVVQQKCVKEFNKNTKEICGALKNKNVFKSI